jgi:hypothetical protein
MFDCYIGGGSSVVLDRGVGTIISASLMHKAEIAYYYFLRSNFSPQVHFSL